MNQGAMKVSRRQIRKAFGPAAADVVQVAHLRTKAHGEILNRGFWGRMKWLFLGW